MIVFQIELKKYERKAGFYEMKGTADSMKHPFRHLLIDESIAK